MRFKIDENLPSEFADILHRAGHDAETVLDESLGGASDTTISEVCRNEKRTLLTQDLDFSNVRAYPPEEYVGLIVFRLHRQDKPFVLNVFQRMIYLLESEPVERRLWIVEENRVRVRR